MRLLPAICFSFALILLAGGCRVAAPAGPAAGPAAPKAFAPAPPADTPADTLGVGALPWRQFFQDPALAGLIDTALRQNLDLRVAVRRVEVFRAQYLARRGALLPAVSAGGTGGLDRYGKYTLNGVGNYDTNFSSNIDGRQRIPGPLTPDLFVGLRSSWEIDLWGKLRSRRKAAFLRVLGSEQGRNLVVTNVVADVARAYYELLTLDNQLATLLRNARFQQEGLRLIRVQKEAGRVTELAVQQFAAQALRTESLAYETRQRITETETGLNQLLGRYPRPIRRGPALPGRPGLPARLGAGLPAAALLRRSDVRRAELELQATRAEIDAARAAFLPSLTLTPYVGLNAFRASLLLDPGSVVFGAVAGLAGPVLNRAQYRADLRQAVAGNYEDYYRYQQALQAGFREVVVGLQGLENYRAVADLRAREVAQLRSAVATANDLFVAGYASYLEVITAQRSVLEAELGLADARQAQLLQSVNLYRGPWAAAGSSGRSYELLEPPQKEKGRSLSGPFGVHLPQPRRPVNPPNPWARFRLLKRGEAQVGGLVVRHRYARAHHVFVRRLAGRGPHGREKLHLVGARGQAPQLKRARGVGIRAHRVRAHDGRADGQHLGPRRGRAHEAAQAAFELLGHQPDDRLEQVALFLVVAGFPTAALHDGLGHVEIEQQLKRFALLQRDFIELQLHARGLAAGRFQVVLLAVGAHHVGIGAQDEANLFQVAGGKVGVHQQGRLAVHVVEHVHGLGREAQDLPAAGVVFFFQMHLNLPHVQHHAAEVAGRVHQPHFQLGVGPHIVRRIFGAARQSQQRRAGQS